MKKSYVKPQVHFENFQLSANIAGNCGTAVHHSEECTFIEGVGTLFATGATGCNFSVGDDGNADFCHHGPNANTSIFSS